MGKFDYHDMSPYTDNNQKTKPLNDLQLRLAAKPFCVFFSFFPELKLESLYLNFSLFPW